MTVNRALILLAILAVPVAFLLSSNCQSGKWIYLAQDQFNMTFTPKFDLEPPAGHSGIWRRWTTDSCEITTYLDGEVHGLRAELDSHDRIRRKTFFRQGEQSDPELWFDESGNLVGYKDTPVSYHSRSSLFGSRGRRYEIRWDAGGSPVYVAAWSGPWGYRTKKDILVDVTKKVNRLPPDVIKELDGRAVADRNGFAADFE